MNVISIWIPSHLAVFDAHKDGCLTLRGGGHVFRTTFAPVCAFYGCVLKFNLDTLFNSFQLVSEILAFKCLVRRGGSNVLVSLYHHLKYHENPFRIATYV